MDDPVEDDEASEGLARDLAEGGGDGLVERTRCADSRAEVGQGRAEPGEHVAEVRLRGRFAAIGGGERCRPTDHVLEHAPDGELGARGRVVELVGRDTADDADEKWGQLVELGQGVHGSSDWMG